MSDRQTFISDRHKYLIERKCSMSDRTCDLTDRQEDLSDREMSTSDRQSIMIDRESGSIDRHLHLTDRTPNVLLLAISQINQLEISMATDFLGWLPFLHYKIPFIFCMKDEGTECYLIKIYHYLFSSVTK